MIRNDAERTRADFYREKVSQIREQASHLRRPDARSDLNSLADNYERLANYVEAFWGSSTAPAEGSARMPHIRRRLS